MEFIETRNDDSIMPRRTAFAIYVLEEMRRQNDMTQQELAERSGIADSTLGRLLTKNQEPKISQVAKVALALKKPFWYMVQRTGIAVDTPGEPSAEARRIGAILENDPELQEFMNLIPRLSVPNRRTVMGLIRSLLDQG